MVNTVYMPEGCSGDAGKDLSTRRLELLRTEQSSLPASKVFKLARPLIKQMAVLFRKYAGRGSV